MLVDVFAVNQQDALRMMARVTSWAVSPWVDTGILLIGPDVVPLVVLAQAIGVNRMECLVAQADDSFPA